jgi:hypothetical protein
MPKASPLKAPFAAHEPLQPFAVSPKKAAHIEQCGLTELYERLNNGEYETYLDGAKRQITLRSIRARQERKLAAAGGPPRENSSPRRGRPRKTATT